jgi:hypothetical protein
MSIRKVSLLLLTILLSACQAQQMSGNYQNNPSSYQNNPGSYQNNPGSYQNGTVSQQAAPQASFSRGSQITPPMNSNPQIPIYQNKTVNCNPNGFGGYTCR